MKKLLTIAFALVLGASLSFAQAASPTPASTDKKATTTKKKTSKKGGKKSKKNSSDTTATPK